MTIKNKYIVLEGVNGITLNGSEEGEVNFKELAYSVLFEGTLKELKESKYKHLIIE